MLKGINPMISPELLKMLCEMGHGDEIVIADANFPAVTCAKRLVRADGHSGTDMLEAILALFPLDKVAEKNALLMAVSEKNVPNPPIWKEYEDIMKKYEADNMKVEELERYAFYDRAKNAFAVVQTGEKALYANIILKKGTL